MVPGVRECCGMISGGGGEDGTLLEIHGSTSRFRVGVKEVGDGLQRFKGGEDQSKVIYVDALSIDIGMEMMVES